MLDGSAKHFPAAFAKQINILLPKPCCLQLLFLHLYKQTLLFSTFFFLGCQMQKVSKTLQFTPPKKIPRFALFFVKHCAPNISDIQTVFKAGKQKNTGFFSGTAKFWLFFQVIINPHPPKNGSFSLPLPRTQDAPRCQKMRISCTTLVCHRRHISSKESVRRRHFQRFYPPTMCFSC